MRLTLVVLGWVIVGFGALRTVHLLHLRLWARAAQVASWVILAGGLSLLALISNGPRTSPWLRYVFAIGLLTGTAGLVLQRATHANDQRHPEE